ncbi:MAG TPA: hypothetical protein VIP11_09600 [Gemmatimonadaceae bacterium]
MPIIELLAQLGFSLKLDSLQWRTGTFGLFSSALLTPTFGLVLALCTAYAFDHAGLHRVLTWLAAIIAVGLVAATAMFVLDAFQLRAAINPQVKRSFTLAMIKAVMNFGISALGLFIVFVSAFKAGRRDATLRAPRADAADVALLVRR